MAHFKTATKSSNLIANQFQFVSLAIMNKQKQKFYNKDIAFH